MSPLSQSRKSRQEAGEMAASADHVHEVLIHRERQWREAEGGAADGEEGMPLHRPVHEEESALAL